jgi:hypothetical protein
MQDLRRTAETATSIDDLALGDVPVSDAATKQQEAPVATTVDAKNAHQEAHVQEKAPLTATVVADEEEEEEEEVYEWAVADDGETRVLAHAADVAAALTPNSQVWAPGTAEGRVSQEEGHGVPSDGVAFEGKSVPPVDTQVEGKGAAPVRTAVVCAAEEGGKPPVDDAAAVPLAAAGMAAEAGAAAAKPGRHAQEPWSVTQTVATERASRAALEHAVVEATAAEGATTGATPVAQEGVGDSSAAAGGVVATPSTAASAKRVSHDAGQFDLDSVVDGAVPAAVGYREEWLQEQPAVNTASAARPCAKRRAVVEVVLQEEDQEDNVERVEEDTDAVMDAISRALKSGVDKETLKQYIDDVADAVADKAGSWVVQGAQPTGRVPEAARPQRSRQSDGGLVGSEGGVLEYGPSKPPLTDWDMTTEAREEREARKAQQEKEARRMRQPTLAGHSRLAASMRSQDVRLSDHSPYAMSPGLVVKGDDEVVDVEQVGQLMDRSARRYDGKSVAEYAGRGEPAEVPGLRLEGFDGDLVAEARAARNASKGRMQDELEEVVDGDEGQIGEVGEGQTSVVSLEQLKAAAKKHGLDLPSLLSNARDRGLKIR